MKNRTIEAQLLPSSFLIGVNYHTSSNVQYFYKTTEIYLGLFRIVIEKIELI